MQLGHDTRQAHAHERTRQVDDAPGGESGGQQRQLAEIDEGRSRQYQHERRADRVPGVGHRRQDPPRRHPAKRPVDRCCEHEPDADRHRHERRGQHQQHRDEDQLRGNHVTGSDRELDPGDDGVDGDQQRREARAQASRVAGQRQCSGGGREQRRRGRVDRKLTSGRAPFALRPAALEQPLGRRLHLLVVELRAADAAWTDRDHVVGLSRSDTDRRRCRRPASCRSKRGRGSAAPP